MQDNCLFYSDQIGKLRLYVLVSSNQCIILLLLLLLLLLVSACAAAADASRGSLRIKSRQSPVHTMILRPARHLFDSISVWQAEESDGLGEEKPAAAADRYLQRRS